jgi:outer membrane protein OmpA-like peptidoglycan-associated protein
MDTKSRKFGSFGLVSTALWIAAPLQLDAQWTVTMRAMQNPVAVGQCAGIEVTVVDERGFPPVRPDKKQASGWDFDLEFTAATPDAFVWRDERHRFLCAKAPTAPSAVVVARYPARHLKPTERVPGLALERSIEVTMQGVPAGPPMAVATAAVPAVGAAPSGGGMPPVDPAAGYPTGVAPGTQPGVAPGYPANGYPAPAAPPAGYSAPGYSATGPASVYGGTPPVDPSQGYGPGAAPVYPNGAAPASPQAPPASPPPYGPTSGPQYGTTPVPQTAPTPGYPYPVDPASQTAQAGQAAQPPSAQPGSAQPGSAQPVSAQAGTQPQARSFKQMFKKIGSHAKQQAQDLAGNTVNYTADAANSVVDNTLTSGSDLVKSNVQSTAGGLGGVGQALFQGAKAQDPKDLTAALASGRVVLKELRFQEHTGTLDPSSGPLLAQLAQALQATPGQFLVEAHVEKVEEPRAQALSDQRAAAVKSALVSLGVPATQLVATGYGASRPLSSGSSARVEIARTQ